MPRRMTLLSTTLLPLAVLAGTATVGIVLTGAAPPQMAQAACNPCNPCAAAKCNPCAARNPCAAAKCNPCAARNPCNPCAAANPCNPCGVCNPCNPCGGGGGGVKWSCSCVVPSVQLAAACNPCAVKACNPCNPCAAAKCNPCAAKACNPCNPCAAANPCNPCAATNPCNPCGACNPCNPCASSGWPEITAEEAGGAFRCLNPEMRAAYAKSRYPAAVDYDSWQLFSIVPYVAATHGGRYVHNYANERAAPTYAKYEKASRAPVGSKLAKASFVVGLDGRVGVGPLFLMEKMPAGFNADGGNWKYAMVMPDGSLFGETNGKNSAGMQFCITCHIGLGDETDSMLFLPEEARIR